MGGGWGLIDLNATDILKNKNISHVVNCTDNVISISEHEIVGVNWDFMQMPLYHQKSCKSSRGNFHPLTVDCACS